MSDVSIRPLRAAELDEADRIFRLAFGTFVGLKDPLRFAGDSDYVRTRFGIAPEGALAAVSGDELLGSNFVTRWGSFGFFGPLSIRPDLWERGVAKRLLVATVEALEGTRHAGLFTFAQSAKHVALYQKFGFWPGSLGAVMSRPVSPAPARPSGSSTGLVTLASLAGDEKARAVAACRDIAGAVYPGLDLTREIEGVDRLGFGDTVLVRDGSAYSAFAVCHCGARTEAGSDVCFVKFGAADPRSSPAAAFDRLLDASAGLAAAHGLGRLVVGVATANRAAYRRLLETGFRTDIQGVAMHRPDDPGYHLPETWVLGDWR
jgi:predicted N-acetyltransferase YhbS